jgi:hypothetical protein
MKTNRQFQDQSIREVIGLIRRCFMAPAVLGCSIAHSQGVTLAGVDFDGRTRTTVTTNNDTASPLNWSTDGVADPGSLTAVPNQALTNGFAQFEANGLFQTGNTQDAFVPDLNIHNEGSFYVDIPLEVTAPGGVIVTGVSLTGIITNNGGAFQGVAREADYFAEVLDSGDNVLGSDFVNGQNAFQQNAGPVPTTQVDLDFGSVALDSGSTYTVRLYVGADGELVGNNAGFDNLEIIGTVVPEPGTGILGALAGFLLLGRRRR